MLTKFNFLTNGFFRCFVLTYEVVDLFLIFSFMYLTILKMLKILS